MHDASTWEARVGSGRELLAERYPRGSDQLLGSLTSRFSPAATKEWFEAEGVTLKVEASVASNRLALGTARAPSPSPRAP